MQINIIIQVFFQYFGLRIFVETQAAWHINDIHHQQGYQYSIIVIPAMLLKEVNSMSIRKLATV